MDFKNREERNKYYRDYYHNHKKEWLGYMEKYASKNRDKILNYRRQRNSLPKVKKRANFLRREKYHSDESFRRKRILAATFRRFLVRFYNKGATGILPSTKLSYQRRYGIDFDKIFIHLLPLPKEGLNGYELDHINPVNNFDFTNKDEISKAYSPENIRIITSKENKERKRN